MAYHIFDFLLTLLHLVIIGFNLLGWIWPSTRKLHFISVLLTAGSWLFLGIWYGIGYCPITDWQWEIKESLGEKDLPNSFIKYYADKISGKNVSANFIDITTAVCFIAATFLSIYMNFLKKKPKSVG